MSHNPFVSARVAAMKRIIVATWGLPKTRKTSIGLSGPEPVRVLNLDFGLEELLSQPMFRDKQIEHTGGELHIPGKFDLAEFERILSTAEQRYKWALEHSPGGTVMVDTTTEFWQLIQAVELEPIRRKRIEKKGDDATLFPFDYGAANLRMRGFLKLPHKYPGVNVVWTFRAKPVYDSKGQIMPGLNDPQWFGETPSWAQVVVHTFVREILDKDKKPTGKQRFFGKITHNRYVNDSVGMDMEDLDYPTLREICFDE